MQPQSPEEEATISAVESHLATLPVTVTSIEREHLDGKVVKGRDLILTLGGDGTFIRTSHYVLDTTPVLGVNTDPQQKEGFYMACTKEDFASTMDIIRHGKAKLTSYLRLETTIKDPHGNIRKTTLATNEVYIGPIKHSHALRYLLKVQGREERQLSSGVLVATPTGSHGWVKSAGGKPMSFSRKALQYLVREPHVGRVNTATLIKGILPATESVQVTTISSKSMVVIDSLSEEYSCDKGTVITVSIGNKPLYVFSFSKTPKNR